MCMSYSNNYSRVFIRNSFKNKLDSNSGKIENFEEVAEVENPGNRSKQRKKTYKIPSTVTQTRQKRLRKLKNPPNLFDGPKTGEKQPALTPTC